MGKGKKKNKGQGQHQSLTEQFLPPDATKQQKRFLRIWKDLILTGTYCTGDQRVFRAWLCLVAKNEKTTEKLHQVNVFTDDGKFVEKPLNDVLEEILKIVEQNDSWLDYFINKALPAVLELDQQHHSRLAKVDQPHVILGILLVLTDNLQLRNAILQIAKKFSWQSPKKFLQFFRGVFHLRSVHNAVFAAGCGKRKRIKAAAQESHASINLNQDFTQAGAPQAKRERRDTLPLEDSDDEEGSKSKTSHSSTAINGTNRAESLPQAIRDSKSKMDARLKLIEEKIRLIELVRAGDNDARRQLASMKDVESSSSVEVVKESSEETKTKKNYRSFPGSLRKALKNFVQEYYSDESVISTKDLLLGVFKYGMHKQPRWSLVLHRDVISFFHVSMDGLSPSREAALLYARRNWKAGSQMRLEYEDRMGLDTAQLNPTEAEVLKVLRTMERLHHSINPKTGCGKEEVLKMIADNKWITKAHVPTQWYRDTEINLALIDRVSIRGLINWLPSLTTIRQFYFEPKIKDRNSEEPITSRMKKMKLQMRNSIHEQSKELVSQRLHDKDTIKAENIAQGEALMAYVVYSSSAGCIRKMNEANRRLHSPIVHYPVESVTNALANVYQCAVQNCAQVGKKLCVVVDSRSRFLQADAYASKPLNGKDITAALLHRFSVSDRKNIEVIAYGKKNEVRGNQTFLTIDHSQITSLDTAKIKLCQVVQDTEALAHLDLEAPIVRAQTKKSKFDCFLYIISRRIVDPNRHFEESLQQYRDLLNKKARVIFFCAMQGDMPLTHKDMAGVVTLTGFNAQTPDLLAHYAREEIE